jgi:putative transcriptional regulator
MESTEVERMMLPKRYFLLFLSAFLLCGGAASKSALYDASPQPANLACRITGHYSNHSACLSPAAFRSFVSLDRHQPNGRLSKGKFLVASRQIRDPRFQETVILLIQHDLNGTVGLIVNRPTTVRLSDFFPEIKEGQGSEHFTYIGGPVGMTQVLLLIHVEKKLEGSQWIFDDVYVSSSKAVLEQLIEIPAGETKFRAYAGYAGWGSGQLEQEIARGDWHVAQADAKTIFIKPPAEIWPDLIRKTEMIRVESASERI